MFITTANLLDPSRRLCGTAWRSWNWWATPRRRSWGSPFPTSIPRQLEAHGLTNEHLEIAPAAVRMVIASYTREAGLRNLEREVASLCRGAAREIAEGTKTQVAINEVDIAQYLGPPKFFGMRLWSTPSRGGHGSGLDPTGGDILFIEVLKMPGKRWPQLTGQLGEVMKESASAALSYIRAGPRFWGSKRTFSIGNDLHIHVPAGAIPKDGPSAGVALLCALVSLLSNRPIKKGLAMTGEITLRGTCWPVGGIKNKVLAAHGPASRRSSCRPEPGGPGGDPARGAGGTHLPPGGTDGTGPGIRLPAALKQGERGEKGKGEIGPPGLVFGFRPVPLFKAKFV